jgi:hypothetical protein
MGSVHYQQLWRCYALWRNRLWVMIIPTFACIGAIGEPIVAKDLARPLNFTVCNPIYVASNAIEGGGGLDASKAIIAATCLSVGMNIIVTFLILLRLLMASKALSRALPDHKGPSMYTHVAAIIIESAAPLTLFGIGFIIATALTNWSPPESILEKARRFIATDVFSWLYYSFCVSEIDAFLAPFSDCVTMLGSISPTHYLPGCNWAVLAGCC